MLPLKKRPYRGYDYSVTKRLKRAERQIQLNKPEVKSQRFFFNSSTDTGGTQIADGAVSVLRICGVSQGTSSDDRIGDKVRIKRIHIRGHVDNRLDYYLIRLNGNTQPKYEDFSPQQGGFLSNEKSIQFKEVSYMNSLWRSGETRLNFDRKFNHIVKFLNNTATGMSDGEFVIVVKNDSGALRNCNFCGSVWYTDA